MSAPKAEAAGLGLTDVLAVLTAHEFDGKAYYQRTDQWTATCLADGCEWSERGDMGGRDAALAAHRAHVAKEVRTWYRAALTSPDVVEAAAAGLHAHFVGKHGYKWPAPEQHLPWWREAATAALAAAAETLGAK